MENLLTKEEVAEILKIEPTTVYKLVNSKKIPHVKWGNILRFRMEDVLKFIKDNLVEEHNVWMKK